MFLESMLQKRLKGMRIFVSQHFVQHYRFGHWFLSLHISIVTQKMLFFSCLKAGQRSVKADQTKQPCPAPERSPLQFKFPQTEPRSSLLGKLVTFQGGPWLIGKRLMPHVLDQKARTRNTAELRTRASSTSPKPFQALSQPSKYWRSTQCRRIESTF